MFPVLEKKNVLPGLMIASCDTVDSVNLVSCFKREILVMPTLKINQNTKQPILILGHKVIIVFPDNAAVPGIAHLYLGDRAKHDDIAAEWTVRFAK